MIGKVITFLGALLLLWAVSACGTIEVDVADQGLDESAPADDSMATAAGTVEAAPMSTAQVEPRATLLPAAETAAAGPTSGPTVQDATADWLHFYDETYGIALWHPPGTSAVIGEPARPVFSSAEFPEGIVEEQVFVIRVIQGEDGSSDPGGRQLILEVKLVANPEEIGLAMLAERYSQRCPGALADPLRPTTVSVGLSGYRYGCEGIDGIIFNEFWALHPDDPQLLLGAAWADMFAPLADQILATVTFTG